MLNEGRLSLILMLLLTAEAVYFFIILSPAKEIYSNISRGTAEIFIAGDFFGVIKEPAAELPSQEESLPKITIIENINPNFEGECSKVKFGKCIEIDISEQKFYTFQNGFLIGEYLTSTGAPGRATKLGVFSVQSKYELAYGYIDGVHYKMPYWLGIYYAGATENGIHELPYINGVKETNRDLGRRVSHGCVRLDEGIAKKVYEWAEIGTPVIIHN